MRHKIIDYIDLNKLLFDSEYATKTFVSYEDLFISLENDIETTHDSIDDIDESHQHYDTLSDDNIENNDINDKTIISTQKIIINQLALNQQKHIVISLSDTTDTDTQTYDDSDDDDKSSLNADAKNYVPWEQRTFMSADNQYILPIADALEKSNATIIANRDRLKNDIAALYKKRKEITLNVRKIQSETSKDIAKLKSSFKGLGMPVPQNFLDLTADISTSKILKNLNLTPEELGWRYPELKDNLQQLYRLRVFASFLPIYNPVINPRRSSPFGYRRDPFTKQPRMHTGLDFAAKTGTPLIASGAGVIKFAGIRGGYGNTVEIYHGNGIMSRYAHLSRILVKKGQRVIKGGKIGAVGSTGRSTGAHLHYEIRINNKPVNPNLFLNKKEVIVNIINKY